MARGKGAGWTRRCGTELCKPRCKRCKLQASSRAPPAPQAPSGTRELRDGLFIQWAPLPPRAWLRVYVFSAATPFTGIYSWEPTLKSTCTRTGTGTGTLW